MKNQPRGILLIDDDEVDVISVKRAMQKVNVTSHLQVAQNGVQALKLLRQQHQATRPSIIILDLNMPQMDGFQFLEELRADDELKSIPVIILTTSSAENDKIKAFQSHVAGYIVKPLSNTIFIEAINTFNTYWTLSKLPA